MNQLLTMKQAAEYLSVSISTLKRLLAKKQIAFIKMERSVRLEKTDLETYIVSKKVIKAP